MFKLNRKAKTETSQENVLMDIGDYVIYTATHRNAGTFEYDAMVDGWRWLESRHQWQVTINVIRFGKIETMRVPADTLTLIEKNRFQVAS